MNIHLTYHPLPPLRLKTLFSAALVLLIAANIFSDYLFSRFQDTGFYLSESLLFSSFWILFFPLIPLLLQQPKNNKTAYLVARICLFTAIHLLIYPALVWILSKSFYNHTFPYLQTFNYGLTAYLIKALLVYGFSVWCYTVLSRKSASQSLQIIKPPIPETYISTILVTDHQNNKLALDINAISHFSVTAPYITIYHQSKKYLHSETLRSLAAKLDNKLFVRIHKSHLVNLQHVASYKSRQNGDYDLTLTDGTVLRISRSYAKEFKFRFEAIHRPGI